MRIIEVINDPQACASNDKKRNQISRKLQVLSYGLRYSQYINPDKKHMTIKYIENF